MYRIILSQKNIPLNYLSLISTSFIREGWAKVALPAWTALAPASRNSRASAVLAMPPMPTSRFYIYWRSKKVALSTRLRLYPKTFFRHNNSESRVFALVLFLQGFKLLVGAIGVVVVKNEVFYPCRFGCVKRVLIGGMAPPQMPSKKFCGGVLGVMDEYIRIADKVQHFFVLFLCRRFPFQGGFFVVAGIFGVCGEKVAERFMVKGGDYGFALVFKTVAKAEYGAKTWESP